MYIILSRLLPWISAGDWSPHPVLECSLTSAVMIILILLLLIIMN